MWTYRRDATGHSTSSSKVEDSNAAKKNTMAMDRFIKPIKGQKDAYVFLPLLIRTAHTPTRQRTPVG